MINEETKKYAFNAFSFLGIDYNEIRTGMYELIIPTKLKNQFNTDTMLITFDKTYQNEATYLTNQSFFIKKIAKLVTLKYRSVSYGSIHFPIQHSIQDFQRLFSKNCSFSFSERLIEQNDYLVVWYKFTLKGFETKEEILAFQINIKTKEISSFPYENSLLFSLVKPLTKKEKIEGEMDELLPLCSPFVELSSKHFISNKTKEANRILDKEIKRIHDFYDLLEMEEGTAETSDLFESRDKRKESLRLERNHLIDQQRVKYTFKKEDLVISPIEYLFLKTSIEKQTVSIHHPHAKNKFELRGDKMVDLHCSLTHATEGPFLFTSDGRLILEEKAEICEECHRLFDFTQVKKCAVCEHTICTQCSKRSYISHAALCSHHACECPSCHETVSIHELKECQSCKIAYCSYCLSDGLCNVCIDLY